MAGLLPKRIPALAHAGANVRSREQQPTRPESGIGPRSLIGDASRRAGFVRRRLESNPVATWCPGRRRGVASRSTVTTSGRFLPSWVTPFTWKRCGVRTTLPRGSRSSVSSIFAFAGVHENNAESDLLGPGGDAAPNQGRGCRQQRLFDSPWGGDLGRRLRPPRESRRPACEVGFSLPRGFQLESEAQPLLRERDAAGGNVAVIVP